MSKRELALVAFPIGAVVSPNAIAATDWMRAVGELPEIDERAISERQQADLISQRWVYILTAYLFAYWECKQRGLNPLHPFDWFTKNNDSLGKLPSFQEDNIELCAAEKWAFFQVLISGWEVLEKKKATKGWASPKEYFLDFLRQVSRQEYLRVMDDDVSAQLASSRNGQVSDDKDYLSDLRKIVERKESIRGKPRNAILRELRKHNNPLHSALGHLAPEVRKNSELAYVWRQYSEALKNSYRFIREKKGPRGDHSGEIEKFVGRYLWRLGKPYRGQNGPPA